MTLNQLLREVYSLGFEDTGELNESFLFCANRAKRMIYSELAKEKHASLIVNTPKISYYLERYTHTPGKTFKVKLSGNALSFKYSGTGTYTVTEASEKKTISFNKTNGVEKAFFNGECELSFSGDLSFLILDLTAYSEKLSNDSAKIPIYYPKTEIALGDHIPDFGILTRLPEDKNGDPISGASVSGDTLRLPFEWSGEVFICYKPSPSEISINDPNAEIELPFSTEHLLPLLTASYLWLDDDPEKSEYYASVYRTEVNRIFLTQPKSIGAEYRDVLGWA